MRRIVRPFAVAIAAAVLALSAACAGATGTATPAAPGSTAGATTADPVSWMDKVCGSLDDFKAATSTPPQVDSSSPQAAIKSLSSYLDKIIDALDSAITGMKAAGPSPVKGGDEAVSKLTTALTTVKGTFAETKTKIDQADPNDPTALQDAVAPLQSLQNLPNPLQDFTSNAELDKAADQAPKCKALQQ